MIMKHLRLWVESKVFSIWAPVFWRHQSLEANSAWRTWNPVRHRNFVNRWSLIQSDQPDHSHLQRLAVYNDSRG